MFAALNSFLTRAVTGYFLNKSLRFRSSASAYLNRTPATATNQKTWTWSGWVKRGSLSASTSYGIFGSSSLNGNTTALAFINDTIVFQYTSAYPTPPNLVWATAALYRDPAAWYHIVLSVDTTQASSANAVQLWVNGSSVALTFTAYTGSYVQNTNYYVNGTSAHQIGQYYGASYYDGEQAEVNFIDGQALAPTAFGASSTYNQWLPIAYAGTYGTNGFYLPFSGGTATSYAGSFNGSSQYLSVAKNAAFEPSAAQPWTMEAWFYITSFTNDGEIFTYGSPTIVSGVDVGIYALIGATTGAITSGMYNSVNQYVVTSSSAVPLNAWVHFATVSTGSAITVYVNGISVGSVSTSLAPNVPASVTAKIGYFNTASPRYFPGQISNFRFVKGTAVYTANFVPPTTNLTAITNTSLLTLQGATIVDNSTNAFTITNNGTVVTSIQSPFLNPTVLTADSSGNANNWTPNNISLTAGSTYDSLTDVPTLTSKDVANYPVLSPLSTYNGGGTLSNGNLTVSLPDLSNNKPTMATDTGKWYAEFTCVSAGGYSGTGLAIVTSGASTLYPATLLRTEYGNNGQVYSYSAGAYVAYGSSWTNGDVIGVAWDCSAAQVTFYKNGVSQGTLSSPAVSLTPGGSAFNFIPSNYNTTVTASFSANYGQQPWKYSLPSGFLPLNTFNI